MRKAAYLALGVFLFWVTSANAQNQSVMYNFDHEADFSKYKTYRWVSIKSADLGNFQLQEQIKGALEAELQKKGLTKIENGTADLDIGCQGAVSTETKYTTYEEDEYGQGWGDGWQGRMVATRPSQSKYTIYIGQLALDMYDDARKKIVWRAVASKTIDPKASPQQQKKKIARAAFMLLEDYPPSKSQ